MTPLGHAATGYLAGHALHRATGWRLAGRLIVAATVVGALLPDVDWVLFCVPGLRSTFNAVHRVVTHNLLFAAMAAVLGAWAARRWAPGAEKGVAAGLGLGVLVHILADSMFDANPSNGLGVAWLWPFDARCYSPFNLALTLPAEVLPSETVSGWENPWPLLRATLWVALWELPWVAAATAVFIRSRARSTSTAALL